MAGAVTERTPLEDRLRSMRRPGPSPELRERALARAAGLAAPPVSWVERWWASRSLRIAWAGALVLLVAANLGIGRPQRSSRAAPTPVAGIPAVSDETRAVIEDDLKLESALARPFERRLASQRDADIGTESRLDALMALD